LDEKDINKSIKLLAKLENGHGLSGSDLALIVKYLNNYVKIQKISKKQNLNLLYTILIKIK